MLLIILYFLKFQKEYKYVCEPKKRNAYIKFAVGMIVEIRSNQMVGVIIGWIGWNKKDSGNTDARYPYLVICTDNKLHYIFEGINRLYHVNYFML